MHATGFAQKLSSETTCATSMLFCKPVAKQAEALGKTTRAGTVVIGGGYCGGTDFSAIDGTWNLSGTQLVIAHPTEMRKSEAATETVLQTMLLIKD